MRGKRNKVSMKALLDTHILLWWFEDKNRLPKSHNRVIQGVTPDNPLLVSDISLWEVATLFELGRIRLRIPLQEWLQMAVAPPLVELCLISPAIAAEVSKLPSTFHRDPADRIIASTAIALGATLLTCDERILQGNVCSILK